MHKKLCTKRKNEGLVACVLMTDPLDCTQVFLKPDDPIFDECSPSKVMKLCGIPLSLKQMKAGSDNQWCTYLMIDPISGFAPYPWSDCGQIFLCRQDRMPVTPEHIYQLGDFISNIISEFGGDNDEHIHKRSMTKKSFLKFLQHHLDGSYFNSLGIGW